MSVNLGNLELTLIQKINSSTTPIEIQTYTKALEKLRSGNVYTVSTYADLPDRANSLGEMYYIVDEESLVFATNVVWVTFGSENNFGFGFGFSDYCALTFCNLTHTSPVQETSNSTNWCCIHAGDLNSYGLKKDGTIWAWGYAAQGRLPSPSGGVNPRQERTLSSNWCSIAALNASGSALKSDGTLWSWGCNGFGDIGNNTSICCATPVQENSSSTDWSILSPKGDRAESNSAIKTDGTLWSWGWNRCGLLGVNNTTCYSSPVQEISSSTDWCFSTLSNTNASAIKTDGTLWGWGSNSNGRLGVNNTTCYSSPVQEISSSTNWCYVSNGYANTTAIKTDGTLWSWGGNGLGELAVENIINYSSPVQEISSSTNWCLASSVNRSLHVLKTDGSLWMWGNACYGLLLRNEPTNYSSPIQDPFGFNWINIHGLGTKHTQGVISVPYL